MDTDYPPYIVLSPVGNYMDYIIEEFIESIRAFDPQPEKIVLAIHADHHFDIDVFKGDDIYIEINPEMSVPDKRWPREASGREILRKHFIYGPKHIRHALWIDTDIICPPNIYTALYNGMIEGNVLIAVNEVSARDSDRLICGGGLMLTERTACTMSRFYRALVEDPNGYIVESDGTTWSTFSSDYVFFAVFDQCARSFRDHVGRGGRICEEFVRVEHKWRKL